MLHKGCGGKIKEDLSVPGYHYNPDKDTANEDDPIVPVYRCEKCKDEIAGDAQIQFLRDGWADPNQQAHHTFGDSRAAERLKQEIDKGANYRAAVRLLNKYNENANALLYCSAKFFDVRHLLLLLRKDAEERIANSSSDESVKSFCRNLVVARDRLYRKAAKDINPLPRNVVVYTRSQSGFNRISK